MPCPYAIVCTDCPGDEDYEPEKGTLAQEDGIKCLDFNRLLPYKLAFPSRKLPGGRHVADAVESMDKLDASGKRYSQSPQGKATQHKWSHSEKGVKSRIRHTQSEKYKLTQQKYRESQKGKQSIAERKRLAKLWRKIKSWLKENPDKTYEDYFKEHPGEEKL